MSVVSSAMRADDQHISGRREQMGTRAMFLVAGLAMAGWAPLVPFAKARADISDGALGLVLLCLGLGSLAAMPATGVLTARFGCRAVMACASIVVAAILPVLGLANDVVTLAVALAIFGAGIGALDVAMNIQAVMVEKDSGKHMMSGFHGLFSLGGILGAGGVSLLLRAGLTPVQAILCISVVAIVLLAVSRSGLLPYGNRDAETASLFILPRGIVAVIGLLCFIVFLGEGAVLDWSALLLINAHGANPDLAGFGYAVFAVAMTIGRLTGDRMVKTFGGPRILAAGGAISAAGFVLAVLAPTQLLAFGGFLLVGLGASNIVPVLFTAAGAQTRMPAGQAIAAVTTIGYAGILLGPAAIGGIAQVWTLGTAMLLIAVGLVAVAIVGPWSLKKQGA